MSFSEYLKALQEGQLPTPGKRPRAGMQLGPVRGEGAAGLRLSTSEHPAHLTDEQIQRLVAK